MTTQVSVPGDRSEWNQDNLNHLGDAVVELQGIANGGSITFLPASNGSDDTAALNAILALGGNIAGKLGANYKISAPLVIPSNTSLDLTGCTVTLLTGANCNMLQNYARSVGSGRDSNIQLCGGTWARGSVAGVNYDSHSIMFQRVDGLWVHDLYNTATLGHYSVDIYACTDFVVERILCNTAAVSADGVHLEGACRGGTVRDIWGTCGGDMVGVTPANYTSYQNGDLGDVTDIIISGIYPASTGASHSVRLTPGTHSATVYSIRRVKVQNVTGNGTGATLYIGGDPGNADTQNGSVYDVDAENIMQFGSGHNLHIADGGTGVYSGLSFSHIGVSDSAAGSRTVLIDASAGAVSLNLITFRDCYWQTVNAYPVEIKGGAVVANLVFDGCYFAPPASTYAILMSSANTTITSVKFNSCRLNVGGAGGGLILTQSALSHQVSNVFATDLTVDQAAHCIGDWASGVSTNLYIDGLRATTVNDLIFNRSGSTINLLLGNAIVGANAGKFGSTGTVNNNAQNKTAPAYSASITPVATDGPWQTITVSNGTAFTINAPTNPPDSAHTAELTIEILNSSGGAMGVITWNAAFVFAGETWANPATTKKRYARFEWNGLVWVCTRVAPADY